MNTKKLPKKVCTAIFEIDDALNDAIANKDKTVTLDIKTVQSVVTDLLEKVANSYEDTGCDGCGTVSKEVINEVRQFLGWKEL